MRELTIVLAVLFLALPASVPAQAGETTELTVAADIPGARAAVYAVAIDPETEYSDGESLRTLGETLEEVIRSSGAEPAAEAGRMLTRANIMTSASVSERMRFMLFFFLSI